jgi:hypothetical protein
MALPDIHFLNIESTRFERAPDSTLRVEIDGDRCGIRVQVLRAFPLKFPEQFIVLRDGDNKELGLVEDLKKVPQPAQSWLRDELFKRYFLPQVEAIHDITERFGTSVWDLETDRGRRTVTTSGMNEAVFEVEANRFIITDVEGNRYEIKDLSVLDSNTRARFMGKL